MRIVNSVRNRTAMQIRHFIFDHPLEHKLDIMGDDGSLLASTAAHLKTDTLRRKGRKADPETWPIVNMHRYLVGKLEPPEAERMKKYVYQRGEARVQYRWNGHEGFADFQSSDPVLILRLPKPEEPAEEAEGDSPAT